MQSNVLYFVSRPQD